jgi:hypothetical protein
MKTLPRITAIVALSLLLVVPVQGQSLRGSRRSVTLQYRTAHDHHFTFLTSGRAIRRFVEKGYLVPVRGDENYGLGNVSYPYARPEAKLFIERLAAQYRAACGERLIVTSLTRPRNDQPRNASRRSVHPTGMAVDIRRSHSRSCRVWLESTLLSLEKQRVLEATRERHPPHYHVAVFPKPYARYVAALPDRPLPDPVERQRYEVRRGDSLWSIARNYGLDVDTLKAANHLSGSRIYAGQVLTIPAAR